MKPIQASISLPHHHIISDHNNRVLSFGPQDQKSGLRAMPEDTEREAKDRQGQNWPGKNVLPNLSMEIKVAPFVSTRD